MNCLYCPEGASTCPVCNPPASARGSLAERFPGATATQQNSARRGLHAMGHPMPTPESALGAETCKTCAHLERHRWTRTFLKCALTTHTGGLASDTRARWPACARWRSRAAEETEQRAEEAAGRCA